MQNKLDEIETLYQSSMKWHKEKDDVISFLSDKFNEIFAKVQELERRQHSSDVSEDEME